jgi:hypothetical protein
MRLFNDLISIEEARLLINNNRILAVAASEAVLKQLPKGRWIGGTTPYFMTRKGGIFNEKMVFVTDLTEIVAEVKIVTYTQDTISHIADNNFDNGLTHIIMPCFSNIHTYFAVNTPSIKGLMDTPTYGWVSGVDTRKHGKESAKVMNGETLQVLADEAVCMHLRLKDGLRATIDIVNIFSQLPHGDVITFDHVGFSFTDCFVNGKKTNLARYIIANTIDTKLPIVADFSGTSINAGIRSVDKTTGITNFYAPLQPGIDYRFASFHNDYLTEFKKVLNVSSGDVILSCNCFLNYLYSDLEGKSTGNFCGPLTFGEVAYILVNQTMVYVRITP